MACVLPTTLDGRPVSPPAESVRTLHTWLLEECAVGHLVCGTGACGACLISVEGKLVASCVLPLATVRGKAIRTVGGLAQSGAGQAVLEAFERLAPGDEPARAGMMLAAAGLLEINPHVTEDEVRAAFLGIVSRQGYDREVAAALVASRTLVSGSVAGPERPDAGSASRQADLPARLAHARVLRRPVTGRAQLARAEASGVAGVIEILGPGDHELLAMDGRAGSPAALVLTETEDAAEAALALLRLDMEPVRSRAAAVRQAAGRSADIPAFRLEMSRTASSRFNVPEAIALPGKEYSDERQRLAAVLARRCLRPVLLRDIFAPWLVGAGAAVSADLAFRLSPSGEPIEAALDLLFDSPPDDKGAVSIHGGLFGNPDLPLSLRLATVDNGAALASLDGRADAAVIALGSIAVAWLGRAGGKDPLTVFASLSAPSSRSTLTALSGHWQGSLHGRAVDAEGRLVSGVGLGHSGGPTSGSALVELVVDRETGHVSMMRVVVATAGPRPDALAHGVALGYGRALAESITVDEATGMPLTASLADLRPVTSLTLPEIDHVTAGAGSAPTPEQVADLIAGAVLMALADALDIVPAFLPMTPDRVLDALMVRESSETNP